VSLLDDEGGVGDARRQILLLASRMFAEEIDAPLLAGLLGATEAGTPGDVSLVLLDAPIASFPREVALEELSAEFCRLFIGPNPPCPPYASMHRSGVLLGGRSARSVEQFMAEHGIALAAPFRIAASDHVAVELSVLAWLSEHDARREQSARACEAFLADHLLTWAPAYLRRVATCAKWAPYRTLSAVTASLLEHWAQYSSTEHNHLHRSDVV
jgi:TorA maturation chaperone TorD